MQKITWELLWESGFSLIFFPRAAVAARPGSVQSRLRAAAACGSGYACWQQELV